MKRYGLTEEAYQALLNTQKHVCAICGCPPKDKRKRWCIDHDHNSGKVRGLLCLGCNMGLGHFHNNAYVMRQAAKYLEDALQRGNPPASDR